MCPQLLAIAGMQKLKVCKDVAGRGDVLGLRVGNSSSLAELCWVGEEEEHLSTGGHLSRVTCDSQITLGDAGRRGA